MNDVIIFGITRSDTVYIYFIILLIMTVLITIIRHNEEIYKFQQKRKRKIRSKLNHINDISNDDYMTLLDQDFENNMIYF